MLGHPKSSCPKDRDTQGDEEVQAPIKALRIMTLTSPAQDPKKEKRGSIRDQSSRLDNQLDEVENTSDVFGSRPMKKGRHSMPGTLIPPISADGSIASVGLSEEEGAATKTEVTQPFEGGVAFTFCQRAQSPLSRSMSAMERDLFVFQLASRAGATSLVIPKADAEAIRDQATALKFTTHLVVDREDDSQAMLILGQEESSVRNLARKVAEVHENATRRKETSRRTSASGFKTVAGAALVGAVSTWAGLALS